MKIEAAIALVFFDFDLDAVLLCEGVLADAGYLPAYFYIWRAGPDDEAIPFDLLGYDRLSKR